LDSKVFVEGANDDAFRFCHNGEQCSLRNRAATGDGSKTCSAAGAKNAVHAVVMKIGSVAAAAGGNAFGKHFENRVEKLAGEIAVRVSTSDKREEVVFGPAVVFGVVIGGACP